MDAPFPLLFTKTSGASGASSPGPSDVAAGKASSAKANAGDPGDVFTFLVSSAATSGRATDGPVTDTPRRPDESKVEFDPTTEPPIEAQDLGAEVEDVTITTEALRGFGDIPTAKKPKEELQPIQLEDVTLERPAPVGPDEAEELPLAGPNPDTNAARQTDVEATEEPGRDVEASTEPAPPPAAEIAEVPPMLSAELAAVAFSSSQAPKITGGTEPENSIHQRTISAPIAAPDATAQPAIAEPSSRQAHSSSMSHRVQADQDPIPARLETNTVTAARAAAPDLRTDQDGTNSPPSSADQLVDASLSKVAPSAGSATPLTLPQSTRDSAIGSGVLSEAELPIRATPPASPTAQMASLPQPDTSEIAAPLKKQDATMADAPDAERRLVTSAIATEPAQPKTGTGPTVTLASPTAANNAPVLQMSDRQSSANADHFKGRLDVAGPPGDPGNRSVGPISPQPTAPIHPTMATSGPTQPLGLDVPPDQEVRLNPATKDEPSRTPDMAAKIGPGAPTTSPQLTAAYSAAPPMVGTKQAPATPTPVTAIDALDPGTASVSSLPQTTASAPSTPTQGTINAPSIPQNIAQHIAMALPKPLSDLGNGTLEIALDPPELGRVRLSLVEVSGTMTLSILADRPETADLMRRNLDILAQEFSRSGLDAPNVRVDTGGAGSGAGTMGNQHGSATDTIQDDHPSETPLEMEAGALPNGTPPQSNRSLDLRL